jgi:hypothetical protein
VRLQILWWSKGFLCLEGGLCCLLCALSFLLYLPLGPIYLFCHIIHFLLVGTLLLLVEASVLRVYFLRPHVIETNMCCFAQKISKNRIDYPLETRRAVTNSKGHYWVFKYTSWFFECCKVVKGFFNLCLIISVFKVYFGIRILPSFSLSINLIIGKRVHFWKYQLI